MHNVDLHKALGLAEKKAKQLEFDNEKLKEIVKQAETERKKREDELKERNSAISRIHAVCSQLDPCSH